MTMPNRAVLGTGAGLALVLGAAGWIVLPVVPAGASSSYEAVARASATEVTIANPSIPTGLTIVGGGPSAQVQQDGLGLRSGSAQFPDAGDSVPTLPGIAAAVFNFPVPAYPFIATSDAGTAPSRVSYPGFNLYSESGDFTTRAEGVVGDPGSAGARSSARIDEARSGDITATATTAGSGFSLGSYGSVSDVESVATVVANNNTGAVSRSTSTSIGHISVPALNITLPAQGPTSMPIPVPIPGVPNPDPLALPPFPVPAGGQTFRDPDIGIQNGYFTLTQLEDGQRKTYVIPSDAALAGFKRAGITITFQAPEKTAGGIISGAYRFAYTAPAPPANTYYNGPTDVTQTTGLVLANVDLTPSQSEFGTTAGSPATGVENGAAPAPMLPSLDAAGSPGSVAPGAVPGDSPATVNVSPAVAAGVLGDVPGGANYLYLVLVLVFGAGLLGTLAVSVLGVRS